MTKALIAILSFFVVAMPAQAEIARFMQVDTGVFRGGQPKTFEDYERLYQLGVRTILNLRTPSKHVDKEREIAKLLGMNFVHAPINSSVTILLPPSKQSVELAMTTLRASALSPVFVHCAVGKDRTGYIVALYRVFEQSWIPEDAVDEMYDIGFGFYFRGLENDFWNRVNPNARRGDLLELATALQ